MDDPLSEDDRLLDSNGRRMPRSFFARDAETVARDLIGTRIVAGRDPVAIAARIVETEAYLGPHDLACHASRGRTSRTEVMFGPPGHAYVYLIYGMHDMFNVVVGEVDEGTAVLVRAVEPPPGLDARTDGPGRLTRALGITRGRHDGIDLISGPIGIVPGRPPERVEVSRRVGVEYSGMWAAAPLRFYDPVSRHVSRLPKPRR